MSVSLVWVEVEGGGLAGALVEGVGVRGGWYDMLAKAFFRMLSIVLCDNGGSLSWSCAGVSIRVFESVGTGVGDGVGVEGRGVGNCVGVGEGEAKGEALGLGVWVGGWVVGGGALFR